MKRREKNSQNEDLNGIDQVISTIIDKDTTEEEKKYMMSQVVSFACDLQCSAASDKKAMKLAETQRQEVI